MKNIIEELWYGNIAPHEYGYKEIPRVLELSRMLNSVRQELTEAMDEEMRALFERYAEIHNEMTAHCECRDFTRGFSLGVQMILAALGE